MTRDDVWKEIDKLGDMCPADSSDVRHAMQLIDKYTAEKVLEGKIEENNMWLAQYRGASKRLTSDGYTASTTEVVANSFEPRINDLQAELARLKEV